MITLEKITTSDKLILTTQNSNTVAKIDLNLGGSLQELTIKGKQILDNLQPTDYSDSYASSILFPFANRINNGSYTFNNKKYNLFCNEAENNNALHGFVYNKKFILKDQKTTEKWTSVTLEYDERNKIEGFPFTYKIQLKYKLSKKSLQLKVVVKNTDNTAFPFTLGWHPYFFTENLSKSKLLFNADKKVVHNSKMIGIELKDCNVSEITELSKNKLDDCFVLKKNEIEFNTPNYHLNMQTDSENTYLQIFTPNHKNAIAIEPLTGISDSFNNKEGLQILEPNKTFKTTWKIKIDN